MAGAVRSEVLGGRELRRALAALDAAAAEQMLRVAVKAGALPIENAAEQRAPKKTRTLARSITTAIVADRDSAEATIGPSGSATAYAAQKEFGGTITAKNAPALHWVDAHGAHHFAKSVTQPAQPYLRPAWDENVDGAVKKMQAVLKVQIERAGR